MADGVLDLSSIDATALIVKPGEVLAIIDSKGSLGKNDADSLYAYLEENAPDVKILVVSGEGLQIAKIIQESDSLRLDKPAKMEECSVCHGVYPVPVELHHDEVECNLVNPHG